VWEVVAVCPDVVIGARIGDAAAEMSDCNTQTHTWTPLTVSYRIILLPADV